MNGWTGWSRRTGRTLRLKIRDVFDLLMVALLFAGAFLLMRVAGPAFGVVPLIEVRLAAAALLLVPIVVLRGKWPEFLENWRPIAAMAMLHYALPFCLFTYALYTLTGSFTAIINASSPLFAGVIAALWIGERLPPLRIVGVLTGFLGVVLLVWDKVDFAPGASGLAIAAAVAASCCYGFAVVLAKRHLGGVSPLTVAAGSMLVAALILLPLAIPLWPEAPVSSAAWIQALMLGVACTALAFVLYFRLIASVGPTRAISVTFLVPAFAVAIGAVVLDEPVTAEMLVGGAVILLGTGLSTGLIGAR